MIADELRKRSYSRSNSRNKHKITQDYSFKPKILKKSLEMAKRKASI